jgi:uncharacterized protein
MTQTPVNCSIITLGEARYPYQAPIDAYGNGGFRFADMSHRGSILCLPSGIHAWDVASVDDLTPQSFERVLAGDKPIGFLLLGTGVRQVFPSRDLKEAFAAAGIGLEPMDTGAAARTYNVLLAEKRAVGAALIAVE